MRLLDRFRRAGAADPDSAPTMRGVAVMRDQRKLDIARAVAKAPADFDRRTRRAYGSPFRWLSYAQQTGEKMTDRYTRRHGLRVLATVGTHRTRRERKEAARVGRAMA